jgi:hypothetical protein
MTISRTLLILLVLVLAPPAAAAQNAPTRSGYSNPETSRTVEPPRPFVFRMGGGYTRSAFDNLTDGGNLMAAFVWPAASVARVRVEASTSVVRWRYYGWDPGEPQDIDSMRWITTDMERLSGVGAFFELAHRSGAIRPYLLAGVSLYHATWKDSGNTDYGVAAGGGLDIDIVGWRFFAEGSLRLFGLAGQITDDPQGVAPLTIGLRF